MINKRKRYREKKTSIFEEFTTQYCPHTFLLLENRVYFSKAQVFTA